MSLPLILPTFTVGEYLEIERDERDRHEFLDGVVFAMAGESLAHSTICFNLAVLVGSQIRGTPCRGFSPNMKVRAGDAKMFAYPDLAVACGEPRFHDERRDVLLNPTVVFEVLSPTTEAYDRGEKFRRYREHVESLADYVLVAQDRPHVEHHARRPDGTWALAEFDGLDSVLTLPSINCKLPLSEIYERVPFGAG